MGNENLYEIVKNRICDEIFKGHYSDADKLPPERELEEMLEVSRVTVRKSLEILEDDGLIVRQVGRGTTVTLRNRGNKSKLDMIVLIAPARNPFFAEFIARFQNYAETQDALLLYVEKPRLEELENCLYRLYKRGLRNAVVWLEDLPVDVEKLRRLRAHNLLLFVRQDKECLSDIDHLTVVRLFGSKQCKCLPGLFHLPGRFFYFFSAYISQDCEYPVLKGVSAPKLPDILVSGYHSFADSILRLLPVSHYAHGKPVQIHIDRFIHLRKCLCITSHILSSLSDMAYGSGQVPVIY